MQSKSAKLAKPVNNVIHLGFPRNTVFEPSIVTPTLIRDIFLPHLHPHDSPYTAVTITVGIQNRWIQRLLINFYRLLHVKSGKNLSLINVSGYPDDRMPLAFCASLAYLMLQQDFRLRCIDVGNQSDLSQSKFQAVVIHNVLATATDARIEAVRDILLRYHDKPRFLVNVTSTPLDLFFHRICLKPDVSLHFEGWDYDKLDTLL